MKHFHYISDIFTNDKSKKILKDLVNPRIFSLLMQDNTYPIIEHDDKHDLFVLLIPNYEDKKQKIRLIECNILISDRNVYFLTNHHEEIIDSIIDNINTQRTTYDSTIYTLILELSTHILNTIDHLEHVIDHLKHLSRESQWYTEDNIQDIMKLKLTVGMFKSTISPLSEIMLQFFEIVNHPDSNTETIRTNHISYMLKQIMSETTFLYENISILADTSNAIQNIRANNIMKTLTIISSIFIPLSFMAGLLGMNFPVTELYTTENFYLLLIIMSIVWGLMYSIFRYKKRF